MGTKNESKYGSCELTSRCFFFLLINLQGSQTQSESDREVGLWKSGTRLKSGFLSIENRAYVAIPWTPKTGVRLHGSCRTGGKNRAIQPLSNFLFLFFYYYY